MGSQPFTSFRLFDFALMPPTSTSGSRKTSTAMMATLKR